MQAQHIVSQCLVLVVLLGITTSSVVEISLSDKFKNIDKLSSFGNKSYEIPLFQKRILSIQVDPNRLQEHHELIGYKFQIEVSDKRVVRIEKVLSDSRYIKEQHEEYQAIAVEDLYICKSIVRLFFISRNEECFLSF